VRARHQTAADPRPAPEGFAEVYERYFADIYRYIAGRLGRNVADDIAADTFVIALRKHSDFDPGRGPVRAWLYGIATNLVAQHRRAEKRRYQALARAGAQELTAGHDSNVAPWAGPEAMQPRLARALARLSREERDVLLLVALVDLSYQEISQALGIPDGTVGSRLNRARRKIRAALDQEDQIDE
jgi:RNA polymerase sigma-70 factor (ECF subfamily)